MFNIHSDIFRRLCRLNGFFLLGFQTKICHASSCLAKCIATSPVDIDTSVPIQSVCVRFVVVRVALGQGFLPVPRLSTVSIIPPLLHTHSFAYHPRCIMFSSQYFSFPCQYHSTIAPYPFIHLPPTLYNVFLPVPIFPLSVSFHHCSMLDN